MPLQNEKLMIDKAVEVQCLARQVWKLALKEVQTVLVRHFTFYVCLLLPAHTVIFFR
jgi:hypothetical protein